MAQEEARGLGHAFIGDEHILLALIRAEDVGPLAAVGLEAARAEVVEFDGRSDVEPTGHIPFTTGGKKILEMGLRESLTRGDGGIANGHLYLAILHNGAGSVAVEVLKRLGIDTTYPPAPFAINVNPPKDDPRARFLERALGYDPEAAWGQLAAAEKVIAAVQNYFSEDPEPDPETAEGALLAALAGYAAAYPPNKSTDDPPDETPKGEGEPG